MSDVVKPQTDEEQAEERAHGNLRAIAELRRSIPFDLYFQAEPRTRIVEIEATLFAMVINRKPIDESARQFLLGEMATLKRWRDKLDQDEAGNKSILTDR